MVACNRIAYTCKDFEFDDRLSATGTMFHAALVQFCTLEVTWEACQRAQLTVFWPFF